MVGSSIQEKKPTQNLDDGCLSTSIVIKKKAAKDWKRCSLRKEKLRSTHSTRTIKAGKPIIPPKPRLLSSARSIVPADSRASPSQPGKPVILPKPCLSKPKAERPIIAPKPRMQAWDSERPIIQSKPQVPSHEPKTNIRPMPPVTQMCPIAVLTPMGFLIPRNFPSAILMNQAVTLTEDEQIHPDDPVQVGLSDPVAQTHDFHKRTNVSSISNELYGQLTDLFASMCQVQDSSDVADHIKAENFDFSSVSKHTEDSAVMQNPRLALALRNILLDVQVIQIEAPEMMEMLKKKTGGHKEYKRGVHAISARLGTTRKAGEPSKFPDPNTGFCMDMHRKHFAQNIDVSYRSESPTACKFKVISSAETGQETEHKVAETAEALEERVLVEKKGKGIRCTENEASCTPSSSFLEKPSREESQSNWKDVGSSVAEKIVSFSQLIEERTRGAVKANMKTNNSKATCSNVINRKESNKSNGSMHRPPKNVKFGEKEEEERHFGVLSNNNLTVINADPPSVHDGTIEIPRSSNPESDRVTRSDRIPKLVEKEICSESKHARGNGNPTEVIPRKSLSKSDEVQERARAVMEDLKRRLADTQGSTTTVTQDRNMDIWDSFSSSSSLDDEHIYEEIDEITEVFGTKTDEDLSLHNKFSAMSKENTHHIEEVLVKASELTTASIHSLAKAASPEKEAVMSGKEAKSKRKLQEERRDAKGGKLKSVKKGDNAGVAIKNKEKPSTSTSQQSDTSLDISSEDEESKDFCFVIGF